MISSEMSPSSGLSNPLRMNGYCQKRIALCCLLLSTTIAGCMQTDPLVTGKSVSSPALW